MKEKSIKSLGQEGLTVLNMKNIKGGFGSIVGVPVPIRPKQKLGINTDIAFLNNGFGG